MTEQAEISYRLCHFLLFLWDLRLLLFQLFFSFFDYLDLFYFFLFLSWLHRFFLFLNSWLFLLFLRSRLLSCKCLLHHLINCILHGLRLDNFLLHLLLRLTFDFDFLCPLLRSSTTVVVGVIGADHRHRFGQLDFVLCDHWSLLDLAAKTYLRNPLLVKQYICFLIERLGFTTHARDGGIVTFGPPATLRLAIRIVMAAGRGPTRVHYHTI